ncbi:MAG: DUF4978 domain-containing protein [Verrucomicrobiota bacterium]
MKHSKLITGLLAALLTATVSSQAQLSYIDTHSDETRKIAMIVEGKPFFPNVGELSICRFFDETLFNWSDDEIEAVIQQIKADGYTTVKMPYYWGQLEVSKDVYDWSMLEKSIDFCVQANLPLIFNFWGSEFVTASWIYDGLLPKYVMTDYDYVLDKDGNRVEVNYHYHLDKRSYPKLDKCDDRLRAREAHVLKTIMNHIRAYIDEKGYPDIVIGVQLQNEPTIDRLFSINAGNRSYSESANEKWNSRDWPDAYSFNNTVMFEYLNELGRAVKESDYPVWTMVNYMSGRNGFFRVDGVCPEYVFSQNEVARAKGESYIDFLGMDIYRDNPQDFVDILTDRYIIQGRNYPHIPETSAGFDNVNHIFFTVLAHNGTMGFWEYLSSGDWHWAYEKTLYVPTEDNGFKAFDEIKLKRVQDFNHFLLKNRTALATYKAGGTNLKYFNVGWVPYAEERQQLGKVNIQYKTLVGSGGIASLNEDGAVVLMSTDFATYTLHTPNGVKSAEVGHYDEDDVWHKTGEINESYDAEIEAIKAADWNQKGFVIYTRPYDCVRVTLNEASNDQ